MNPRGQFDDVLWVQLAHSVMAALTIEAGHKAVQAPLAVPSDVNEISIGPDNVIVTDNPDKVQRVPLNVPAAAFQLSAELKDEMKEGAGYPDSRLGNMSSSAITGRGEVSYGFASGVSPNGAIVTLLQLRGDEIIGRDTFRRQLPMDIDVDQQQRELDIQAVEDALKQGLAAALQSAGQMIAQGQTAEALQFFQAASQVIQGRRNGEEISDLILRVFTPKQQPQQPGPPGMPGQDSGPPGAPGAPPGPGGGGDALDGVGPNGLPQGVAPGQAGMPPGGRPSVTDLSAGFTGGGVPTVGAAIRRRVPTG
jgi:hypothetical protein